MIDKKKVIVINKEGKQISLDDWQKLYGLPVGSTKIGKYYDLTEERFQTDLKLYGFIVINELLMRVLDQFREDAKRSVTLNSFNRNQEKQAQLTKDGFRTASVSPHIVKKDSFGIHGGTAADIDTSSNEQTDKEVIILLAAAKKLGIKVRVGWNEYKENKQTFIHVDVACEFYAPGKPWNKIFHPLAWEKEARW